MLHKKHLPQAPGPWKVECSVEAEPWRRHRGARAWLGRTEAGENPFPSAMLLQHPLLTKLNVRAIGKREIFKGSNPFH